MDFSVIIPVYNGADFIVKAYESIVKQNIEDFEILFVDNNSTDNSMEKIKEVQETDTRVKLFEQKVQGAAAARNKGLEHAKGEYVYMFDVDDQIFPNALKKLKSILDEHPKIDAVFGKMKKLHKNTAALEKPEDDTREIIIKEKPYWGLQWLSDLRTVVGPPAFLYRRRVFDTIGSYNISLQTGEDTALDIKLGMLCNVAFIDLYIYVYYKHEQSSIQVVKKNKDRVFMQWPRYVKSHLPFYRNHEVPYEFKRILFKTIFVSIGRMLNLTNGIQERRKLKKQLFQDIKTVKTSFLIRLYLEILVLFNFSYVFKFYIYYWVPALLPSIIKKNDRSLK
ncbi:glycosyltransferase family 2 protein [Marixanthomonas ophiurae]|nr:glycosyltransferase [Marixanthomonas ophiurae]